MNGGVEFNGLLGVLIFFATVILLAGAVILALAVYLIGRRVRPPESMISRYFLISGLILLVFDGVFYLLVFLQNSRPWQREESVAFDENMLMIWAPAHIVSYFAIAFAAKFLRSRREAISGHIDKLR